jgi:hypothetical protein
MKLFAATVISLSLFASGTAHAQARAAAGSGAAPTSSLQDSQTSAPRMVGIQKKCGVPVALHCWQPALSGAGGTLLTQSPMRGKFDDSC